MTDNTSPQSPLSNDASLDNAENNKPLVVPEPITSPLAGISHMNKDIFWQMIDDARNSGDHWKEMLVPLQDALAELQPTEIVHWKIIMGEYVYLADKWKLTNAIQYINNGISDDGFHYFSAWLVAQGKETYLQALADPDSLADNKYVQAYIEEMNTFELAPISGYVESLRFESFLNAPAVAYERIQGEHLTFYNQVCFYADVLSSELESLANDIHYADGIDDYVPYESYRDMEIIGPLFPKLMALVEPERVIEKPSVLEQLKETQKAKAQTAKAEQPSITSKSKSEREV
jgi:hypothetical protein